MKMLVIVVIFASLISCRENGVNLKDTSPQTTGVNMEILLNPEKLTQKAPKYFKVLFTTTKGNFVVEVEREWAPHGADRFYNLVKNGFYNDVAFFRVIKGFVAQFGINGNPMISQKWLNATIPDDEVRLSNIRGTISFASRGPNTRTTQLFINYADNSRLDSMGFAPFGKVIEGMEVIDKLYSEYGEGEPYGSGPSQIRIQTEGNEYLKKNFPQLDYIISAQIIEER